MTSYLKLISQFSKLMLVMIFIPTLCLAKESVTNFTESKSVDDGKTVSQSYSFTEQPFDAIELAGDFDLVAQVVHQPHIANIVVTASSSLLPYIKVYVKNKTLHVAKKDAWNFHLSRRVKIRVTVDNLASVQTNGSSDVVVNNIKTNKFEAGINGSGTIFLQGNTKNVLLEINGSGKIKSKDLIAENAKIGISGSGLIVTNATNKIDINIDGSGTVEYNGNPRDIEQSINGSGKIKSIK